MADYKKPRTPREAQADYAKRRGGKPTLSVPSFRPPSMGLRDYSKLSPIDVSGGQGPLSLDQRFKKPRL